MMDRIMESYRILRDGVDEYHTPCQPFGFGNLTVDKMLNLSRSDGAFITGYYVSSGVFIFISPAIVSRRKNLKM
jgi:hypothetical protein